ncbi:hypothetical protein TWF694_008508 [Orbilia ellipsospora]|uniref:H-type lectin domain-containing protein n=1 Tax=Orbilia ellipsospora TaxID=2528407 RepID=A0AAV9XHK5_9PEZI
MALAGKRDGAFVKFSGWDVPGHDVAYYPNLSDNVDKLKDVMLNKPGHQFYAFNTKGWIKSWTNLDWSEFTWATGCDLYIRVEYPGWCFFQGQDSISNDITQVTDASTGPALIGKVNVLHTTYADNRRVAAINTNGWIKSKVIFPLTRVPDSTSLDGIYVRTTFQGYNFFPLQDSVGGDLYQDLDSKDNIPDLIAACDKDDNVAGFNTNGWIKNRLVVPPTEAFSDSAGPTQGLYVRIRWPGFTYLPGLDSPGNDLRQVKNKTLPELIIEARNDSQVVAFNTDGWMKYALNNTPSEFTSAQTGLFGLYVKVVEPSSDLDNLFYDSDDASSDSDGSTSGSVDSRENGESDKAVCLVDDSNSDHWKDQCNRSLFALKGTHMIWKFWFIDDAKVRNDYNDIVTAKFREMLNEMETGKRRAKRVTAIAHRLQNNLLTGMCNHTSPLGLEIAQGIKTSGGSMKYHLNSNAKKLYNKAYSTLRNREQMTEVAKEIIRSAGRGSVGVTKTVNLLGSVGKATMAIAAALSIFQAATADDWKYETGRQIASWSRSIARGWADSAVGLIFGGPIGAVMGGLAGSFIGGLASEGAYSKLANWFFGGSSDRNAMEILGEAHEETFKHVKQCMLNSGRNYYIHFIFQSHLTAIALRHKYVTEAAIKTMAHATNLSDYNESSDEVLATIVWIAAHGETRPVNPGNPQDFMILLDWVYANQPQGVDKSAFDTREVRASSQPTQKTTKTINFSTVYADPPTLALGLTRLDVSRDHNICVGAFPGKIMTNAFEVQITAWGYTVLYAGACQWFEAARGDFDYQCGKFSTMDDHPWNKPQTKTSYNITFPRTYDQPPVVVVWLNELNLAKEKNWRIKTYATEVTATGFRIHIDTWHDSVLYCGAGYWIAYPSGKALVTSGQYSTADVRSWSNPRLKTSGQVSFGDVFAFPPQVFLGINSLDLSCKYNLRIEATTSEITCKGMKWNINTWRDSILYSAGVSYIALRS